MGESEVRLEPSENEEPKDRYNLMYMAFLAMGLATLLPWNFFISLTGYWDYRFRNVTSTNDDDGPRYSS